MWLVEDVGDVILIFFEWIAIYVEDPHPYPKSPPTPVMLCMSKTP